MSALTLNISKRHRILMKNSSMPNPFWKLKWNLGRKWALLWRWYQQLSENMTVNLRQLKRDYFTVNYKFKAFEKFNNHRVQKRRVKSFFYSQTNWLKLASEIIFCNYLFWQQGIAWKGKTRSKRHCQCVTPFFSILASSQSFFFFLLSLFHTNYRYEESQHQLNTYNYRYMGRFQNLASFI